ncbi:DNA-binding protein [Undibacterium sp. KW1]|uniref:AlbA family DNA-binding domain-containing protein n=1 Tax=Undibacterium sp. KW1 TaxID=2058624 RepID=UPI001331F8EA|nr:ATP-binding protein [Undibacterium sp. KW1]BBB62506.1 DNA-binding protein [Undibacterium sp. KW1]
MRQKIQDLVASQREGDYWDFKERHHENKAVLLHDILCLANTITKCNKYLIYGVSDPSSGCEIKGVPSEGRRSQADIIDFLRSKNFAGDIRPEIELRTLIMAGVEIDVVIVFDHPNKPYYLTEDYRDNGKVVEAHHIYCRNSDTNTPITSSADLRRIEAMWRERFGLDLQPAQRMEELLKHPDDWEKDFSNGRFCYHKFYPEYQIEFGEVKAFKDVYSYFYISEKSFIGTAKFRYLSTVLFTLAYVCCDDSRIEFVDPTNASIRTKSREIWYQYFELNGRDGAFLYFMTKGTYDFHSPMSQAAFILYKSEEQRRLFETYVKENLSALDAQPEDEIGKIRKNRIAQANENFYFDPVEMIKLKNLFDIWSMQKS